MATTDHWSWQTNSRRFLIFIGLLIGAALIACMSIRLQIARKQKLAAYEIATRCGDLYYIWQIERDGSMHKVPFVYLPETSVRYNRAPGWLRSLLGLDFFDEIVAVDMTHWNITSKDLHFLSDLTGLRQIRLDGIELTSEGVQELRQLKNLKQLEIDQLLVNDDVLAELKVALPHTSISFNRVFRVAPFEIDPNGPTGGVLQDNVSARCKSGVKP